MPHHNLTESQLRDFATEHLTYEVNMLIETAQLLAAGGQSPSLTNALLESFTVHLRALIDFIWQPENLYTDDAVASDYFESIDDWKMVQPPFPSALNPAKTRTAKEIVHLTYSRLLVTRDEKQWRFLEMAKALLAALIVFRANALPSKIGDALAGLEQE